MKKWIVLLVLLVAAGFWYSQNRAESQKSSNAGQALDSRPTTAVVETRNIHFKVSAAGDIGPAEQVSVRPEVNGKIDELPVDIGDTVKKGEMLFSLNDQDLQIERSQRVTEIEGATLQVEKAERNFMRSQELFEADLISKELYEDTKTEFELAKNARDRADKNLRLVEDRLSKTKVVAPFDCTVLTRPVSIGQAVSGSGGFNSGTEVLTIADLNQMIVNAHVNQADVTRLTAGQEVEIQIDSVPGLTFKGTVERVAPQSTIKNGIKGYAARINLKDIDPRVRPGMTANLSIPVASSENALAIPLAAVFTEQGERYVLVRNGDTFEKRIIRIGIADYDYAEVLDGLSEGEVIALEDKGQRPVAGAPARGVGMMGVKTPSTGGVGTAAAQRPGAGTAGTAGTAGAGTSAGSKTLGR